MTLAIGRGAPFKVVGCQSSVALLHHVRVLLPGMSLVASREVQ